MTDATHTRESDELRAFVDNEREVLHRQVLASAYGRQMQPETAELCRGGMKTYHICAALDAMRRISTPIPLTPSDGEAVPTKAEWLAFLKANETMHCPVCGSNKRKPNGGAACDCNATWVVDSPSSKPITPSDEMVAAAADAIWSYDRLHGHCDDQCSVDSYHEPAKAALQAALNLMGGKK